MSEQEKPSTGGQRLNHPFPSRRELRLSRIPLAPDAPDIDAPAPDEGKHETAGAAPVPAPVKNEAGKAKSAKTKSTRKEAAPSGRKQPSQPQPSQPQKKVQKSADSGPRPAKPAQYPSRRSIHGDTGMQPIVSQVSQPEVPEPTQHQSRPAQQQSRPAHPLPSAATTKPAVRASAGTRAQMPPGSVPGRQGARRNPKKTRSRGAKWRTAFIIVLMLALVSGAVYVAVQSLTGGTSATVEELDFPGPGTDSVEVNIASGDLGTNIGQTLVDAGVVKTVEGFKRAFDNNSAAATIKPGTYTLKLGMTSAGALAALLDEANRVDNAITVTPGQSKVQVFEKLQAVGGFSQAEIDEAVEDTSALGLPAEAEGNLEGWLAPGSYEAANGEGVDAILARMISATVTMLQDLEVPTDEWQTVLTKSSILEREVNSEEDLPKVARVIENRLSKPDAETRGLLQMDSTVLYGVGKQGGLPDQADMADENPFNTYLVPGLPPAPIASPSRAAVEATLSPAEGDWLYFVTVDLDTGETKFASTLDEQIANTQLLELWCEENPGRC